MRTHLNPETQETIQAAERVELSVCAYCDNIHINLYEELGPNNYTKFATATVGLEQVDGFIHKMTLLRNEISMRKRGQHDS